ncbi:MAG TPA: DUF167 domain-containing protein [Gemmataceae bacterium]|nr:DUF167 domain-containing protein [Gemmataceae bacterium]
MIAITENAQGCILPVHAQPGARRNAIVGEHAGALKVAVTAPPQDGRANQALAEVLREALQLKRAQVELMRGHASREKAFLIRGLTRLELEGRVKAFLGLEQ